MVIGYPSREEEKLIIRQNITNAKKTIVPLLKPHEIIEAQKVVEKIYIDEKIERYIVDIVFATRFPSDYGLIRHRIGLTYEAEANNITADEIISEILDKVEVP